MKGLLSYSAISLPLLTLMVNVSAISYLGMPDGANLTKLYMTRPCPPPTAACQPWSTWYPTIVLSGSLPLVIPCGVCVSIDAKDGSTINVPNGIDIQGKLDIPATSKVKIATPFIIVQGELVVVSSSPVISPLNKNVEFNFTGTSDAITAYFKPHTANSGKCAGGTTGDKCSPGKKGIIVAGGSLNLDGWANDACPSFTTLLELPEDLAVIPPPGPLYVRPSVPTVCTDPFLKQDFESGIDKVWIQAPGTNKTITDANSPISGKYMRISGRNKNLQGVAMSLGLKALTDKCLVPNTPYLFSAKARFTSNSTFPSVCSTKSYASDGKNNCLRLIFGKKTTDSLYPQYKTLILDPINAGVPDGQWFDFTGTIMFTADDLNLKNLTYVSLLISGPEPGIEIALDDISLRLPSVESYPSSLNVTCNKLVMNGNADANGKNIYPFYVSQVNEVFAKIATSYVNANGLRMDTPSTPEDSVNPYFKVTGRKKTYSSLMFQLNKACLSRHTVFAFSNEIRVRNSVTAQRATIVLKRTLPASNPDYDLEIIGTCAPSKDEWVTCEASYQVAQDLSVYDKFEVFWDVPGDSSSDVDIDKVKVSFVQGAASTAFVDQSVASCWGVGSDVVISSNTLEYKDAVTAKIGAITTEGGKAKISFNSPIPLVTSASQDVNFAAEISLLTRNIVMSASVNTTQPDQGGQITIMHTKGSAQKIKGVELKGFGQAGNRGKYPIGVFWSDISGSEFKKNSIRDSFQRCIVLDVAKNVTISENVAYNTMGHCYVLSSGSESGNSLIKNLGVLTQNMIAAKVMTIDGKKETDNTAATFFSASPNNTWKNNVAGGSETDGMRFNFPLTVRHQGGSDNFANVNPSILNMREFSNNVMHSNGRNGLSFYPNGWFPEAANVLVDTNSYRNVNDGILLQSTGNVTIQGGRFSDNRMGIEIEKDCENVTIRDARITGFSNIYKAQTTNNNKTRSHCPAYRPLVGVQLHSFLRYHDSMGVTMSGVSFDNLGNGTTCVGSMAIDFDLETLDKHFDAYSTISSITFDESALARKINLCGLNESSVKDVMIQDLDGSIDPTGSKRPGFIVSDSDLTTAFISGCISIPGSCAQFCPDVCLRTLTIAWSPDSDWSNVETHISNGDKTFVYPNYFEESEPKFQFNRRRKSTAILPGGNYTVTLKLSSGETVWPMFIEHQWSDISGCSPFASDDSIVFEKPIDDIQTCSELAQNGNAEGSLYTANVSTFRGWHSTGGTLKITTPGIGGSQALELSDRKNYFHGIGQFLDSRCFVEGETFKVEARFSIRGVTGTKITCNPALDDPSTSGVCPRASLQIRKGKRGHSAKDGVNVTYAYPVAKSVRHQLDWGYLYGSFVFDSDMASADSIFLSIERVDYRYNLVVDDISVVKTSDICASNLINGDFEVGDTRAWFSMGAVAFDVVTPGSDGTGYALKTTRRDVALATPAQDIQKNCITEGQSFTMSASVKLMKDGSPYVCDPNYTWGQRQTGICPRIYLAMIKDGVTTSEDIGGLIGTFSPGAWNKYFGFGQWKQQHLNADRLFVIWSQMEPGVDLYIDDVKLVNKSAGSTSLLRNQDAESGDTQYWTAFGGATIMSVVGGANGTAHAIAATNRPTDKSGLAQVLNADNMKPKQLYSVVAKVKLLNSTGVEISCDPKSTLTENRCPVVSIVTQSLGSPPFLKPIGSVWSANWIANEWNEIKGYFQFSQNEIDADIKMLLFERAAPGVTIVVDEVTVAETSLDSIGAVA